MSGRGVSSGRAIDNMDQETKSATEAEMVEERGAERLRARLREMLEDRRRVVRLGEQQIEVVEVAAVEDVLEETGDQIGDQTGGQTGGQTGD
jgi:hypothetical protein